MGTFTVRGPLALPSVAAPMSFVTAAAPKQYLTTTWASAPTDPTRATLSYWINWIIQPFATHYIYSGNSSVLLDHNYAASTFKHCISDDGGGGAYNVQEFVIAPDSGVWHHVCIAIDTNQATAADRVKVWVDGTQGTDPPTVAPALGSDMKVTASGVASFIGEVSYQVGSSTGIPDAKFAYFHLIDGLALTPSSFRSGTGHPIVYGGAFGANGFLINGAGSTLADQSPNGIVWTSPNGITFDADLPT